MRNKKTRFSLSLLRARIRSAHKRIRGHEFHFIAEKFNDDTLNLGRVSKENIVSSRVGSTVKKREQMLQMR